MADDHLPLCDADGAPIVTFIPAGVSAKDLETAYPLRIISQNADRSAEVQVGLLYLTLQPCGTILQLDEVRVSEHLHKRGFGSAALRHLIALARVSKYQKIVGELSPDNPNLETNLIRFYKRLGFTVSHTGSRTKVSINVPTL
jgi:ribosomal protein S18 acetylase RimI-like enzyme